MSPPFTLNRILFCHISVWLLSNLKRFFFIAWMWFLLSEIFPGKILLLLSRSLGGFVRSWFRPIPYWIRFLPFLLIPTPVGLWKFLGTFSVKHLICRFVRLPHVHTFTEIHQVGCSSWCRLCYAHKGATSSYIVMVLYHCLFVGLFAPLFFLYCFWTSQSPKNMSLSCTIKKKGFLTCL